MLSVGENIDAYCLKCKLVLAHLILFKVDGVVNRVQCKTCGAEHKYRETVPGAKKTAAVRTPGAVRAKKQVAAKVTVNDAPLQWDLKNRNLLAGNIHTELFHQGNFQTQQCDQSSGIRSGFCRESCFGQKHLRVI